LHKCYLLPETQGRGLGSKALELLCALLVAVGASSVELRVNRHNRSAIGFYGKNGFLTYAEDCREIGGGFVMDDFLMRRDLGAPAAEAGE
jgi:ribosomal protein S18 acetylase RimI-like enzyme